MSNRLIAYRTAPQMEFNAVRELARHGIAAQLPSEVVTRHTAGRKPVVRNVPLARGYVYSDPKPAFAKHVKSAVGIVTQDELDRMLPPTHVKQAAFSEGDRVVRKLGRLESELPGVVHEVTDTGYLVKFGMMGKSFTVFVPEKQLTHYIDPG